MERAIINTADYLLQESDDNRLAIITSNEECTYSDLRLASAKVASTLVAAGVSSLDKVGLIGTNSPFWVASYLAILKTGAVVVPIPHPITPEVLHRILRLTECKSICLEKRFAAKY